MDQWPREQENQLAKTFFCLQSLQQFFNNHRLESITSRETAISLHDLAHTICIWAPNPSLQTMNYKVSKPPSVSSRPVISSSASTTLENELNSQ